MSAILERFDAWLHSLVRESPFTNVYGAARSLVALGGLVTLLGSPASVLFPSASGSLSGPQCSGTAALSIYCITPSLDVAFLVAVVILLLVLSGCFPRWTVVPHWWVAMSYHVSTPIVDGGDQVAAIVTLLIIPVGLLDGRRNHWSPPTGTSVSPASTSGRLVARLLIGAIRVQASVIYLVAGMAKFFEPEWQDGTALYYWLTHPIFGAPVIVQSALAPVLSNAALVSLLTWSAAVFEILLGMCLLLPSRNRGPVLVCAILFHSGIALLMGLVSFSLVMIGLCVLYLRPAVQPLRGARGRALTGALVGRRT